MKVLIGTTNPSKVKRFSALLSDCEIEFLTLSDLGITAEPEEAGITPIENARIKAGFYGQYFDRVICNDSGLYFDEMDLEDPRQPGLNVRTPNGGKRLNDEEMLAYYAGLAQSLGGKATAFYMDGIAVYNRGEIRAFMEDREVARESAFYMVDTPSPVRQPGWPLNSLSLNRNTLTYFSETGNNRYDTTEESIIIGNYRKHLISFLKDALGIR
ncbi:MAG: non-canonical purine NTP pyrophosphatase [Clostridia bacterium]|nr:non-canonical purine NTP pyrophosphatase [Clostridia bacterium]